MEPMGDFYAALAGGGGGAVTAGSAAFWVLKRVVAGVVDEKCRRLQETVDEMRTRVKRLEENRPPIGGNADHAALAQRVATNENGIRRLDGRADESQTTRAEHGVLLVRLREDHDEQRRENAREHASIRAEIAQRLERLADRISTAAPGR